MLLSILLLVATILRNYCIKVSYVDLFVNANDDYNQFMSFAVFVWRGQVL